MRRWISYSFRLTLVLSLIVNSYGALASSPSMTLPDATKLMDEYVTYVSKNPPKSSVADDGRKAWAESVALQIAILEPNDFNVFLVYLTNRFAANPKEREILFEFFGYLRDTIQEDLDNTARIRAGYTEALVSGSWQIGLPLFFTGMLVWSAIFKAPIRSVSLLNQLRARALMIREAPPLVRYGVAAGWATTSALAGASTEALSLYLDSREAHREDPAVAMAQTEAHLACRLSYRTLNVMDRLNTVEGNPEKLMQAMPQIKQELTEIGTELTVLQKQMPILSNVRVEDPEFQKLITGRPIARDWQELRKTAMVTDLSGKKKCKAMALDKLQNDLAAMTLQVADESEK